MASSDRPIQAGRSPFGELLVRLRTEKGLTQEGLARQTRAPKISTRSITYYEKSVNDPRTWTLPHRPTIKVLAAALGLTETQYNQLVAAWDTTQLRKDLFASSGGQGAFIRSGREHLLQHLTRRWHLARGGSPQIVLVSAEAGMGKTSLASYFCELVTADQTPTLITWGESTNYGATTEPYIPIRHATDRLLVPPMTGVLMPGATSNRPDLTTERVEEMLTYLPKLTGALISDRTITTLGKRHPEIPDEAFQNVLTQSVATEATGRWDEYGRLLHALSQDSPILMVLEDLHWAGDLTASLLLHLHHVLGRATSTPIMILGTVRSEEIDLHQTETLSPLAHLIHQLETSHAGAHISMADTLSPIHGKSFIKGLLESYPMTSEANENDLIESLYSYTSGQPLLTTEMLRHHAESGALTVQVPLGLWTFDPAASKGDLPSAISSFIEQRLERVSRRGRTLLEVCAVMGEWILVETIANVLGLEEGQTLEFIDNILVDKHRLLQPVADIQVGQRHYRTYRFPHALVRDYIYSTTPLPRRRSLHIKLAETLTTLVTRFDMITMGAVTNHYVLAEDWHGAEMAAFSSAKMAVGRMAWDMAEFWFNQAEELAVKAEDPRQLWRTRAARLAFMRALRQYDEALALGNRILRQVSYQDWPAVKALTLHHLGEIYYDLGQLDMSIKLVTQARELHLSSNHPELAAAASSMLSHSMYRLGHFDVARDHATAALELCSQLDNRWLRAEAMLAAANCEIDLGFYEMALEGYQASIDLARVVGRVNEEYLPGVNAALCLSFMGRNEEAVANLTALIAQFDDYPINRHIGSSFLYMGFAYEGLGQLDDARAAFQRAIELRESTPPIPVLFDCVAGLLRVTVASGDLDTSRALLQRTESYIAEHTWRSFEYPLLVLLSMADAHLALGDQARYTAIVEEAHEELMRRASLLHDEKAVESYLTRVEMNVRVQERYNALTRT